MSNKLENTWCIIPAAGHGSRMGGNVPKQYLDLNGKPLLAHSLQVFNQVDIISGIAVGLARGDKHWSGCGMSEFPGVHPYEGGGDRVETVMNGLNFLQSELKVDSTDWVIVHDAARPLVERDDVLRLLQACQTRNCGGILATKLVDTVKRSDEHGMILGTEKRDFLWRALTPQCFRLGLLRSAIRKCLDRHIVMTDESTAMELSGHTVQLVWGSSKNFKITLPFDLELARLLLK